MTDLPPYLTSSPHRNIKWTQHNTFPRRSVSLHRGWGLKHGAEDMYLKDLRIFKLSYGPFGDGVYTEMHHTEIQSHLDDPTHV